MLRNVFLVSLSMLALCAAAAAQPDYHIDSETRVVVGADELGASPGSNIQNWTTGTFYNSSAVKVGNQYAIWAQTGWDTAGCTSKYDGLDQVVVFTSSSPDQGFLPHGCGGNCGGNGIDAAEMRASMTTDSLAADQCDDQNGKPWMWGLGDVIPYGTAGSFLATFDLSRDGLGFHDFAKFELTLASSDGRSRTSPMYTFANSVDDGNPSTKRARLVDPVPFQIDADTVGVLFRFFHVEDDNATVENMKVSFIGTGYMTIDFTVFPSSFTVKVLDAAGVYRTLSGPNYEIDFPLKNIGKSSGNRVLNIDGQWVVFANEIDNSDAGTCSALNEGKSTRFIYRPFSLVGTQFGSWLEPTKTLRIIEGSPAKSELVEWDGQFGLMFPSPLVEDDGTVHFYYTKDSECQRGAAASGFGYLDVNHANVLLANENLMPNYGFEHGVIEPFTGAARGTLSAVSSQQHDGLFSLQHISTGNDSFTKPWTGLSAARGDVVGEETFALSAWAKASSSTPIQLFIFCLDQNGGHQAYGSKNATFTATTSWQPFELEHTCPVGTEYVSMRLDNNTSGRTVWWDDVILEDDNLLPDGSFESAALVLPFHGAANGTLTPVSSQAHWGSYSLQHVSTGNDSFTFPYDGSRDAVVAAPSGTATTYRYSAWAKASQTTQIELFLFCLDSAYGTQTYGFKSQAFNATTSWQEFSINHTCPAGTQFVGVRLDNNTAGRTVWWDDVALVVQ